MSAALAVLSGCDAGTPPDSATGEGIVVLSDSPGQDYSIDSPEFARGNNYKPGYLKYDVYHGDHQTGEPGGRDVYTISAQVPMGVDITSAVLYNEPGDLSSGHGLRVNECDVDYFVTCHYDGEHVAKTSLEIEFRIIAPGDHELTAFITLGAHDPNLVNNSRTSILRYVASTKYLQSLLDSTGKNGSVTLPTGTYMGTLHGGDRSLNVYGAEDGGTVLLSDDIDVPLLTNFGNGSTFSNLEFLSSGAPILEHSGNEISIRDSLIAPLPGTWHNLRQLFVSNSYRLFRSRIEGWGRGGGQCHSLFHTGPHTLGSTPSSIYIQNTVFRDNECTHLFQEYPATSSRAFLGTRDENADAGLFILNNTFVNNKGHIRFAAQRSSDVQIKNNIFVAHQNRISLPAAEKQSNEHRFILARNIVWDSSFEMLVDASAAAGRGVLIEAPDLNTDPLFVNSDGGDYSLATGSPAIDAGVPVATWFWTGIKGGENSVQSVLVPEPVSVDGLLDGKAIMDIGAFEYLPW
jgi:hypothetical protein